MSGDLVDRLAGLPVEDALRLGMMTLVLSIARMAALMYVFPLFTRTGIQSGMLRGGLAFGLSIPVMPIVAAEMIDAGPPGLYALIALIGKEALLGIVIGVVAGIPFWAASAAGNLIDFQSGASAASMVDPNAGEETTPMGVFLFYLFAAVYLGAGMFNDGVLAPLYQSFTVWPAAAPWPALELARTEQILGLLGGILRGALILALPIVLVLLILELGLAIATRFVPQINVFFLAMSLKTLATILMLPLFYAILVGYLRDGAAAAQLTFDTMRGFFP
ncbi:MAG: type III secretion system export apparatus subunit SctT [Pseudomonadota bacterium]